MHRPTTKEVPTLSEEGSAVGSPPPHRPHATARAVSAARATAGTSPPGRSSDAEDDTIFITSCRRCYVSVRTILVPFLLAKEMLGELEEQQKHT